MIVTDQELQDLIDTLTFVFEDQMAEGIDPISVASVMLAVSIKQLKRILDPEEFSAIMEDITSNKFLEWEGLSDEDVSVLVDDLNEETKKVIH